MTQILKADHETTEEEVLHSAAAIVAHGGVIAYPTETIYGLGADATDEKAVRRIYEIKGRSFKSPLSVIIGEARDLYPLVREAGPVARKLMDAFWPGPVTIVFEASDKIPSMLTAGTGKIGIRLPGHLIARQIAVRSGRPLTATSANLSARPSATMRQRFTLSSVIKLTRWLTWGKQRVCLLPPLWTPQARNR